MSLHISHPSGYSARYFKTLGSAGSKNLWVWYAEYYDPNGQMVQAGTVMLLPKKSKDEGRAKAEKLTRAGLEEAIEIEKRHGQFAAGGKARHAGGKARHAPERSRLRPFATYCASCHKHISGTEHVWKIAGDKYLCNACAGATGGGKRRHAPKRPSVGKLARELNSMLKG